MGTYRDARDKTRQNLVDAFWELYCSKDISRITVREITDLAGYNRATFYIYFKDTRKVLEHIEEKLYRYMDEVKEIITTGENVETRLGQSLKELEALSDYFCVLLSARGDPVFRENFKQRYKERMMKIMEEHISLAQWDLEYSVEFMVGGMLSTLMRWYEKRDMSIEELARMLVDMSLCGAFPKDKSTDIKKTNQPENPS